jgi:hypothetical protein
VFMLVQIVAVVRARNPSLAQAREQVSE